MVHYLHEVQEVQAEVARAKVEGRKPKLDGINPEAIAVVDPALLKKPKKASEVKPVAKKAPAKKPAKK